jgi:ROK family protein (putative glucokinase)
MEKKLIGIDIGGTTIKIAILEWEGKIIAKWELPTRTENKGENILTDIVESIETKLTELDLTKADIHAAGVGVPGPVQLNVGYLPIAVNLGGWGDLNINDALSKLLELPVITDNDANVAALGEMWQGSGDGATNVVFITLGTGVGGGIIVDGKIISGCNGAGGEIGHMPIVAETDEHYYQCNCSASGCVETVCSATGIVRIAQKYLAKNLATTTLDINTVTSKMVFDAAQENDVVALKVIDTFAKYLAKALNLLSVTVNPKVFVIGGGVSQAGDLLINNIQKYFGENIFPSAVVGVEIKMAVLGNDAGVIGAAKHAKELPIR